jgi:hypothetical protein
MNVAQNLIALCLLLSLVLLESCKKDDDPQNPDVVTYFSANEATDSQGNQYLTGFDQVSSNNQNPYVQKRDGNGNELWRYNYETTGVDGRGVIVAIDGQDRPWVIFTVDGGSNDTDYITRLRTDPDAFNGVYANSYGTGGGPKVSVIARLDPETGTIMRATFVTARLTSGNTNTLEITRIGFTDGQVSFEISSAAWPPGPGLAYTRFPDITDDDRIDGAFKISYAMDEELKEILNGTLLTE